MNPFTKLLEEYIEKKYNLIKGISKIYDEKLLEEMLEYSPYKRIMQKIKAASKKEFEELMKNISIDNIEDLKTYAFISINNSGDIPFYPEDRTNLIRLWFDDVFEDGTLPNFLDKDKPYKVKAMTKDQAIELYKFIKRNKDRNFIIHCTAGICRSGAVAVFINDYIGGNWEDFKKRNPHIQPNIHVYKLLHEIWYTDHEFPGKEIY